jgi:hypothetical protein
MLEKATETQAFFEDMRAKYRQVITVYILQSSFAIPHGLHLCLFNSKNPSNPVIPSLYVHGVLSMSVAISSFRSVKGRGQALQFECARLVTEKKRLIEFAEVLNHKLGYFGELEVITQRFHAGRSQVRWQCRDKTFFT